VREGFGGCVGCKGLHLSEAAAAWRQYRSLAVGGLLEDRACRGMLVPWSTRTTTQALPQ
jgi:hypothetical protein